LTFKDEYTMKKNSGFSAGCRRYKVARSKLFRHRSFRY
jgi:hypothetical protein